jgi:hypothetical protein
MMKRKTILILFGSIGMFVGGCVASPTATSISANAGGDLTSALSGRTLVNDVGTITLGADGRMTGAVRGAPFAGAWVERNGQFCRTITQPARLVGTECQDVTFNGDGTITIDGVNGPVTWTLT